MTITYEFEGNLYVNVTNRCSNDCEFCLRNNHSGVNGQDELWLDREPTLGEICADIDRRDLKKYGAVVFCGYGEPLMRAEVCIEAAKHIRKISPDTKIRINTNGQANMIEKRDITPELFGLIDTVSISLNAPDPKRYDEICHSVFGEAAFDGLLDFAKKAKEYVPTVVLSIVDHDLTAEDIENCRKIAEDCGVTLRVREYIE